ncbi:MAG: hypothetical protein ABIJ95_08120 [Pseudomonadota bacterium]
MDGREQIGFSGRFKLVCRDKDGVIRWEEWFKNLVTLEARTAALNYIFNGLTQVTWYIGLKGAGSPAAGDTLASHAGWAEITAYAGSRKEFVEAAAAAGSITNSASPAEFAINGSATVTGLFLCSAATGTSGVLWCAADAAAARDVESGDTLTVTYTLSAADDGA